MNKFQRTFDLRTHGKKDGVMEMAISSETPVERYFGIEILSHEKDAVDLVRLNDGRHPLLLNHDTDKQIGVMEKAWVDDDRMLRGQARFSRAPLAQEILADVQDGIRPMISVGYEIIEVKEKTDHTGTVGGRVFTGEEFQREMQEKFGESFYRAGPAARREQGSAPPTYVVTRWRPFEASVVPIPADVAVGVGRSAAPAPVIPTEHDIPEVKIEKILEIRDMNEAPKPKTDTDLEVERRNGIIEIGEQYAKYIVPKDVHDALRNGRSIEQFKDTILDKMQSRHTDTRELHIGMEKNEIQRYSIARAIVAAITGDWTKAGLERSASEAVSKILGRTPEGFYVPYDAFHRDFNVGTAGEAGNTVATELRTDLFVDVLRNNLVLAGLGARILTGLSSSLDIPRKATAGTLGMVTEIQALTETNPTTAKISLTPKRLGAYVEYSKQSLIQSSLAVEPMLRDDLLQGAALLLQDQAINGSGAGANMRGIRNTSGIGSVVGGANGIAPAWSHVVDLESATANVNAEPDRLSGYLINTKTRGKFKQTQKATNLTFIWDNGAQPLNGYRAAVSNTVPSNLTKGTSVAVASSLLFASDWSMEVIALFGAPDITVDPYTLATTGQVRITLNQFADHGIRLPACFAVMDDALSG